MKKISLFNFALFSLLLFAACENDDPPGGDPEELITTLQIILTPPNGNNPITLSFKDDDGDGGNAPVITTDTLAPNATYAGVITLLNESVAPAENITEEISDEAEAYQFFFDTSDGLNMILSYEDEDANGYPIGLATTVTTGDASMGTLTIVLRHEPSKDSANVSDGDIINAGGETDIEVAIPIIID